MKNTDPKMIKEHYKRTTGVDLSDDQVKNIINMMNPQMMRQAAEMAKKNPELIKQAQEKMHSQPQLYTQAAMAQATANYSAPT